MTRLHAPIPPPLIQEPQVSLLRASNDALRGGSDATAGRWVGGFGYQPYGGGLWVRDFCDESSIDSAPTPPGVVEWTPYIIGVDDKCSAIGFRGHEFKGRLDAQLKVAKHKAIEAEFWAGALTQAANTGNPYLTQSGKSTDLTPGTVPSVWHAIQVLEQGLADCGLGARGMIHLRAIAMPDFTKLRQQGNLLLTPNGTVVVVGNGYPDVKPGGGAAAAGTTWLFATGMVDVRVDTSNVNYLTTDPSGRATRTDAFTDDEIIMNMNRADNTIVTRAEMFGVASWDTQCWLACKANLDA